MSLFKRNCRLAALVISAPLAFSIYANQAQNSADSIESAQALRSSKAKVIERISPRYPKAAARELREGWVRLSFVIDQKGKVANVLVTDSSGHKDLERSAAKAIERWEFEPAYDNGEAIVQCDNSVQMDFRMDSQFQGARKKFVRNYRKATSHIENKEFDEAKEILRKLESDKVWNYYEDTWYKLLAANYGLATGDEDLAFENLKALSLGWHTEEMIDKPTYLWTLSRVYVFQLERMLLADAQKTYKKLQKVDSEGEYLQKFADEQQQVLDFIENDKNILVKARVGEREFWKHQMVRNDFSIIDVEGSISKVNIRCDKKYYEFDYKPGNTWDIPESWGACQVYVHGDKGASFNLIELPKTSKS